MKHWPSTVFLPGGFEFIKDEYSTDENTISIMSDSKTKKPKKISLEEAKQSKELDLVHGNHSPSILSIF